MIQPPPTSSPKAIELRINRRTVSTHADPQTPLIYVLRNELGLKSAKFACGHEQCGACKVLIDGEALPSCRLPIAMAQGSDIVTLEGLLIGESLHAVQQAFIDEQAVQCGYCTPGMIVSVVDLLQRNPTPSDEEIRVALERNICRCGAYSRIIQAVHRAAEVIAS